MAGLPEALLPPASQAEAPPGNGEAPPGNAEALPEKAKPPILWRVRGPEVPLLLDVTFSTHYGSPASVRILDLGEHYNGARFWCVPRNPDTTWFEFYVEASYAAGGPWFRILNPKRTAGTYADWNAFAVEVVTAARFLRVNPVSVSGTWSVLATPFWSPPFSRDEQPVYIRKRIVASGTVSSTPATVLQYTSYTLDQVVITQAALSTTDVSNAALVVNASGVDVTLATGAQINALLNITLNKGDSLRFDITELTSPLVPGNYAAIIFYQEPD